LNTILGGSISSRLFQKVREENGLAYAIASQLHSYRGGGLLLVYAGTSPGNASQVLALTTAELRRMASEAVSGEDVEVARDHLKGNMLLALESTTSRMSRAARDEMVLGRHQTADEIVERLEAIDPRQIRELAARLLGGRQLALAAVGKMDGMSIDETELVL
ncbi:MAG: insulinase family protein, partial [Acidobacteriota bacterium]|nr:insulinase family protein [Acidobacteriota bacterium]